MANRLKQIEALQAKAGRLYTEVDELLTELQEAYENMPDGIKDSERGQRAQSRIDSLEEWVEALDDIQSEVIE